MAVKVTRPPLFAGTAALFALVAVVSGMLPALSSTGDRLGIRRFTTPAIAPGWTVSERFRMNTGGLRAITVRTSVVGTPAGRLQFELRSLTPHAQTPVRRGEVAAAGLAAADSYRFEFEPIANSHDVVYQLDVRSSPDAPSSGIALRATRGERLANGVLLINGAERWGELAFNTDATQRAWANAKAWAVLALVAIVWASFVLTWRGIIGQA